MARQSTDSKLQKIGRWLVILSSAVVIALAVLYLLGIWENGLIASLRLAGVNMLYFAFSNWKTNRGVAVFNLIAAVFVLLCTVVVLFIK